MDLNLNISIIVPVYNAEKWLCRCVESILNQTYKDFELILVDDGSKDNSGELCDEYAAKDSRVRVVHQPNGGEMAARATGIRVAKGEWLYFVDADDAIMPNALEDIFKKAKDDVDVVVHEYKFNSILNREQYGRLLLGYNSWTVWGKLFRKSLFDDYVMSVPRFFRVGGDFLTQIRLLKKITGKIVMEDVHNYDYNTNNSGSVQLSTKKDYEYEKRMVEEVDSNLNCFKDQSLKDALFHWEMSYLYGVIGYGYDVKYEDDWILALYHDKFNHKLSLREKIALGSINYPLFRLIPKTERKAKNFLRNLLK